MKVSTKSRYGLAAMVDLAEHYGKGPVALRSVAARQQVSEHYLEQLMSSLRKAGVVHSIRGAQGGYVLARDPATISVGDIVRAMEGPIAPVDCLLADRGENTPYCEKTCECNRRDIWQKMSDSINVTLDSISLVSLCREISETNEKERGEQDI